MSVRDPSPAELALSATIARWRVAHALARKASQTAQAGLDRGALTRLEQGSTERFDGVMIA
jgi:hypothetical protein